MARKLRIEYAGAIYHLTVRSNGEALLFADDADRRYLLGRLSDAAEMHQVRIYLFCLMSNHFHLYTLCSSAAGSGCCCQGSFGRSQGFVAASAGLSLAGDCRAHALPLWWPDPTRSRPGTWPAHGRGGQLSAQALDAVDKYGCKTGQGRPADREPLGEGASLKNAIITILRSDPACNYSKV